MRFCLCFASLLFLVTASAFAQSPGSGGRVGIGPGAGAVPKAAEVQSIAFGETRLVLGMPQNEVLDLLGKSFELVRRDKDSYWINASKAMGTIGTITFGGGVLVEAIRDWEIVEPEAGPALVTMKTALAAFRQMIPGDPRDCKVESDVYNPTSGVAVSCGKMLVQLFFTSNEGEDDRVFVHTVLGSHTHGDKVEREPAKPSSELQR